MLGKVARFFLGSQAGAFGTKSVIGKAFAAAKNNPISLTSANNAYQALKIQLYMGVPVTLLAPGTPEEKLEGLKMNLGTAFMVMGMTSPWRQFGWSTALTLLPNFGNITRGIVQGYRGALESRTSVAIPFSHSNLAMDHAFSTMSYSQSRMSEGYQNLTGQAAFYSARYASR